LNNFLKNISLLFLPIIISLVALFFIDVPLEYRYAYRQNVDCITSWQYYRLFENSTPVDVAFIGASHVGCGINDSLITRKLKTHKGKGYQAANLSYCTKGRNIQLPIFKNILKNKQPKVLVIEIMESETTKSHKDFGIISEDSLIWNSALKMNKSFFRDVFQSFEVKLDFFRRNITARSKVKKPNSWASDYIYTPFPFHIDSNELKRHKINRLKKQHKSISSSSKVDLSYPLSYIKEITTLAQQENVIVRFLYVPGYGADKELAYPIKMAQAYGEVWIPPSRIFENIDNWVDGEHLNYWGSKELSQWVADKIIEEDL
jgi:hypothetical protein